MADEGYITFKGVNEGVVDAFYRTQALANAAATGNADIVAHVGLLDLGGFRPNTSYFDGDKLLEEIPETNLPTLDRKKSALRRLHDHLKQLAVALAEEGLVHDIAEADAAHNYPAFAHHGSYLIAHDDDYTDDQVIAWAEKMLDGPSDAATVHDWYVAIAAIESVGGPDGPCAWVNPGNANQLTVSSTKTMRTETVGEGTVSDSTLANGGWIEELT